MAYFINFFFEDLPYRMTIRTRNFLFILLSLLIHAVSVKAQDELPYKKMAFSFNLTRLVVNEVNMGIEFFVSQKRSIEFDGGIVYANEFMQEATKNLTTDPLFSEHGYAARFHYKFWQKKEGTKWRMYIAPGLTYKYLYYKDVEILNEKGEGSDSYNLTAKQDRTRNKAGLEFLWGNVYEANRTFAFEIYYGAGVSVTSTERTDYDRYITYDDPGMAYKNQTLPTYIDNTVYFRPILLAGFKLVIRL